MVLRADSLCVANPSGKPLLQGISMTVGRGELLCVLGPNGIGKTTFLRTLLGVQRPQSGTVLLDGRDVSGMSSRLLARHAAYVPQAASAQAPFTVADMVLMGRTSYFPMFSAPTSVDRRAAADALEQLDIAGLRQRLFTEVSGGERQLALIARAIAQRAQVLILDEPTASLDLGNQMRILRVLRQLAADGRAVVMTSHFPDHALLMRSRTVVLAEGRLVADGAAGTVLTEGLLSRVYGAAVRLIELAPGTASLHRVSVCVPVLDFQINTKPKEMTP